MTLSTGFQFLVLPDQRFGFFSLAFIVGELVQKRKSSIWSDTLITLGSVWFVCIVHFFFTSIAYDILKLVQLTTNWITPLQMELIAYHTTWIIVVATPIFLLLGYLNARTPALHEHTLQLNKHNTQHAGLRLVVASDIHLGPINGVRYVRRIVEKINSLIPDIILLAGDILDGELEPVLRRDLGKYLKKLSAPFGTYGVTGNHEFIGGIDRAVQYITDHGIILLRDEIREVAGIVLAGREDASSHRFTFPRKNL